MMYPHTIIPLIWWEQLAFFPWRCRLIIKYHWCTSQTSKPLFFSPAVFQYFSSTSQSALLWQWAVFMWKSFPSSLPSLFTVFILSSFLFLFCLVIRFPLSLLSLVPIYLDSPFLLTFLSSFLSPLLPFPLSLLSFTSFIFSLFLYFINFLSPFLPPSLCFLNLPSSFHPPSISCLTSFFFSVSFVCFL